jgi:acyl carrier protein
MTAEDALAMLVTVIADLRLETAGELTLDADLRHDLGIDSIDFLDVLFEVNARCAVTLTLEDLMQRAEPSRVATLVACIVDGTSARHHPDPAGARP